MAIIDPKTEQLRRVVCPAALPVADAAGSRMPATPGVKCRVTHDVLTVDTDAQALCAWCCNAGALGPNPEDYGEGYTGCPSWQFDKDLILHGFKSLGDEREMHDANQRYWREDLTGSMYGDTSFMDEVEESSREAMEMIEELTEEG